MDGPESVVMFDEVAGSAVRGVISDAASRLTWASPALPGAFHDLTAARSHGIIDALTSAAVTTFAGKGYRTRARRCAHRSNATITARGCHTGRMR
ncbi:hypothetical protein GCM10022255_091030 [Dactylosporangium darangshiense]|uniref:Uncharacterized protein n=1 Tax=Dactylosporangium darangshiense TaxID=579108 RepID=A0ABP8DPL1_9ACTN